VQAEAGPLIQAFANKVGRKAFVSQFQFSTLGKVLHS
jgi:hypothetical protein